MIPGPNSKVGWKMWKHLEPWQGARLDFEPMQCVYVCVSREEDREGHLKCTVGVTLKQSQPFAEPPRTARNPALAPRTSPEPAPQLSGTSPKLLEPAWNPPRTSRNQPGTHNRNQPETHTELPGTTPDRKLPEPAPNLIWAETPKLTLLGKNMAFGYLPIHFFASYLVIESPFWKLVKYQSHEIPIKSHEITIRFH